MIAQELKPISEILDSLEDRTSIVLVGCGGCAEMYGTGGEEDLKSMSATLEEKGKKVTAEITYDTGEFACNASWSKRHLMMNRNEIGEADAILAQTCGDGLQTVREIVDEKIGTTIPILPAVDTIGLMGGGPKEFIEECRQCGECLLGQYAGICPLTRCAKGLLNGPCGGVREDGKCEVDPDKNCGWIMIYERLEELGEADKMAKFSPAKNWDKQNSPRSINLSR